MVKLLKFWSVKAYKEFFLLKIRHNSKFNVKKFEVEIEVNLKIKWINLTFYMKLNKLLE